MTMPRTLKRLGSIALLLLVLLAACFSSKNPVDNNGPGGECRFSSSGGVPGSTIVAIRNFAFAPAEIRIRANGTVTWVNCEDAGAEAHTSTADQGEWSSASLASGDEFSHTFPQPGVYTYHCVPHPFMTATVVVE
jgi:plastocyanin